jgi:hypothetical protein
MQGRWFQGGGESQTITRDQAIEVVRRAREFAKIRPEAEFFTLRAVRIRLSSNVADWRDRPGT